MAELHFKTTLLPSPPRKKKINSKHCSDKEEQNFAASTVFLCSLLPFPKRLKGLSSSTNIRPPNTYFLLCNHIAKTSSIVYKRITVPLRKEKKKKSIRLCKCVCRVVRWQLPDLRGATRQTTLNFFGRYFKGPSRLLAGHLLKSRNRPVSDMGPC